MPGVVGIDLGIRKAAMCYIDGDIYDVHAYEHYKAERSRELQNLGEEVVAEFVYKHDPAYVFIEDGVMGNNRKYSIALGQTAGAVLSALWGIPGKIQMANISAWKKDVVGKGNATKEDVSNWLDQHYPAYAAACGSDQDKRDATCIALYGQGVVERARGLAGHR